MICSLKESLFGDKTNSMKKKTKLLAKKKSGRLQEAVMPQQRH